MEDNNKKLAGNSAGLLAFTLCTICIFLGARSAFGQSQGDAIGYQSAQVKAAFLYRLPRFIQWQDRREALHFCFDEDSEIMATFKLLVEAKNDVATVSILRAGDQITACDVRFVGNDEVSIPARNQLLVSDRKDFAARGGMIELTRKGARLGLNINLDSLKTGNLRASSQLLKLANVMEDD